MPGTGYSPEFDYNAAKPSGSDKGYDVDNWLRSNIQHQDNFQAKEHYAPSQDPDESEDDYGSHYYITLKELANKPSTVDSRTFVNRHAVFAKSDGIYIEDENGNENMLFDFSNEYVPAATLPSTIQEGYASIPQNEIIVFDKDTAVIGYTLQTDKNDLLLFITKGSVAGGETGGGDHSTGTWDISGGLDDHDAHNHQWHDWDSGEASGHRSRSFQSDGITTDWFELVGSTDERGLDVQVGSADPKPTAEDWYTKNNDAQAHAGTETWRPAARCMTRQKRN